MSDEISRVLSNSLRKKLSDEQGVGAGNILFYALKLNAYPELPAIYLDKKVKLLKSINVDALSLIDLDTIVREYAKAYIVKGVNVKDVVAVYLSDGIEYLIQYLALNSIGAIPALINGSMPEEIVLGFIGKIGAKYVYTDDAHKKLLFGCDKNLTDIQLITRRDSAALSEKVKLPNWFPYQHADTDAVMITHSSGTTGIPKAIILQHAAFFYATRELLKISIMPGFEKLLSALPTSHNSAISYALYALLSGIDLMIVGDRSAENTLKKVEEFRPTTVVAFPKTYVDMCRLNLEKYELNSVMNWLNSGDAAHERHIKKLVKYGQHLRGDKLVQGSQFIDGLGSSEMGSTLIRVVHTSTTNSYRRCVGLPQAWVDAKIFDENEQSLKPNQVGKLGINSPSITGGYWNDSNLTYRSKIQGYWLTGDLAYIDETGCVYHVDRIPDVISTSQGALYSVQAEELLMSKLEEIFECTIVAKQHQDEQVGIAFIQILPGVKISQKQLKTLCNEALSKENMPNLYEVFIVEQNEVPVGITGKVLKRELREQLAKE